MATSICRLYIGIRRQRERFRVTALDELVISVSRTSVHMVLW